MIHLDMKNNYILTITEHERLLLIGALGIALENVKNPNEVTVKSKDDIQNMINTLVNITAGGK